MIDTSFRNAVLITVGLAAAVVYVIGKCIDALLNVQ
jgi:hypothetical protein